MQHPSIHLLYDRVKWQVVRLSKLSPFKSSGGLLRLNELWGSAALQQSGQVEHSDSNESAEKQCESGLIEVSGILPRFPLPQDCTSLSSAGKMQYK